MMGDYTAGNADDITKAVYGLDTFTKNWCMNCKKTKKRNEPFFRCKKCEFRTTDGSCLVKAFVNSHKHDYPMDDFGSMGSKGGMYESN
jgi:hypothetical protein